MIKDKITSQIKNKFRDTIQKTVETGDEYSFYICKDKNENLFPGPTIKGVPTRIEMGVPSCPFKTQGNFHTHADVSNTKRFVSKRRPVSDEVAKRFALEIARKEGIPITTPSHADLLVALLNKCRDRTEGTVCIGSDADSSRVDCWTAKEESRKKCLEALLKFQKEFRAEPPKEWIKPLFDKDIINL